MSSNNCVSLGRRKYYVNRVGLRKWLELEDIRQKAAESRNTDEFTLSVYSYLSVALGIDKFNFDKLYWYDVAEAFYTIYKVNTPKHSFPLFRSRLRDRQTASWDYEGRTWYLWSHILASKYGWSLEYIAKLDIDDAVALIQETLVEEQLGKEWEWGLSEIAYSYDQRTKQTKFNPLHRPDWMAQPVELKAPKKIKIPKHLLPIGNVIRLDKNKDQSEKSKDKETQAVIS